MVNNPILIIARTIQNLERTGETVAAAVEESSALASAAGADDRADDDRQPGAAGVPARRRHRLYRGVGVIVLAGLLCSSAVTLLFLPALLVTVLEWRERFAARRLPA